MGELHKFIEFWHGRHQLKFEIPAIDSRLPFPLQQFYRYNGNRPSDERPFYADESGHQLFPPEHLTIDGDRVLFFSEYQRDWDGYTIIGPDDPPVWLNGTLPVDHKFDQHEDGERLLKQTLSEFLVTHAVLASVYAHGCVYDRRDLIDTFSRNDVEKSLIWSSRKLLDPYCPHYAGEVYLHSDCTLVYTKEDGSMVFARRCSDAPWFKTA